MTTQFAFGDPAARRGRLQSEVEKRRVAQRTAQDPIALRPSIPQAVVTWSQADVANDAWSLPVGAGDPAAGIDGPRPFTPIAPSRRHLDDRMLAALGVMLVALAAAVAWQLDRPTTTWLARDAPRVPIALIGRVPVVESRLLSVEPVEGFPAGPAATVAR